MKEDNDYKDEDCALQSHDLWSMVCRWKWHLDDLLVMVDENCGFEHQVHMGKPTPIHAEQVHYAPAEDTVKLKYQSVAGATVPMGGPAVAFPPCDQPVDNQMGDNRMEVEGLNYQTMLLLMAKSLTDMCDAFRMDQQLTDEQQHHADRWNTLVQIQQELEKAQASLANAETTASISSKMKAKSTSLE